jgi:hypothetical protein
MKIRNPHNTINERTPNHLTSFPHSFQQNIKKPIPFQFSKIEFPKSFTIKFNKVPIVIFCRKCLFKQNNETFIFYSLLILSQKVKRNSENCCQEIFSKLKMFQGIHLIKLWKGSQNKKCEKSPRNTKRVLFSTWLPFHKSPFLLAQYKVSKDERAR